jgi:hypothetical protein
MAVLTRLTNSRQCFCAAGFTGAVPLSGRRVTTVCIINVVHLLLLELDGLKETARILADEEEFLQGSIANGTAICPIKSGEYDIDIAAVTADVNDTAADAIPDLFEKLEDGPV